MAARPLPPILVAEDDPNDLFLFRRQLADAGIDHPFLVFRDGQELIEYLQTFDPGNPRPQVLLLDLKMPRVSGFDVLKWLRNHAAWSDLKVIVLSGSDEPRDIEHARALGAARYCVKPPSTALLLELLNENG
jgi:CheY-like chemotaxis protein